MRAFNDFEKSILEFMVNNHELQDVCAITLFFKFCNCYLIRWSEDYSSLDVAYDKNEDWGNVRNRIFDLIVLLEYLEKNALIGVFPIGMLQDHQIFDNGHYKINGEWPNVVIFEKKNNIQIQIKIDKFKKFNNAIAYFPKAVRASSERSGIGQAIEKYADSTYHVTQTLRDYVNNHYQTKEDLRFKKTIYQTWISIGVSLFIGFASIVVSIVLSICKK